MHRSSKARLIDTRLRRALQATSSVVLCAAAVLAGGTGVAAAGGMAGADPTVRDSAMTTTGASGTGGHTDSQSGVTVRAGTRGAAPRAHRAAAIGQGDALSARSRAAQRQGSADRQADDQRTSRRGA